MTIRLAIVGDENTAVASHREINAVRGRLGAGVESRWLPTDGPQVRDLGGFDGIWLVSGGPYADDAAACASVTWARERDVPFLATCSGMQYAVLELVRTLLGDTDATHAETAGERPGNAVVRMARSLVSERREVRPVPGTRFAQLVRGRALSGMHYGSYAPAPQAIDRLVQAGLVVEATADDAGTEVLNLPANRFFMLSLFHPQVGALAGEPVHPLLREFVRCAREQPMRVARAG